MLPRAEDDVSFPDTDHRLMRSLAGGLVPGMIPRRAMVILRRRRARERKISDGSGSDEQHTCSIFAAESNGFAADKGQFSSQLATYQEQI